MAAGLLPDFLEADTELSTSTCGGRRKGRVNAKGWGPGSRVLALLPTSQVTHTSVFTSLGKSIL